MQLLGVAFATWAVAAAYTLRLNPEIAFFRHADDLKHKWTAQVDAAHPVKFVVFGGSSCLSSIDPRRLLDDHHLPALNLGLGAGMGARTLTRYAMAQLSPGDTLIVTLEPALLSGPLEIEPLGIQFALATGQRELLAAESSLDWPGALLGLRPGGYHVFTLAGKILLRQPLYRYAQSELQAGGWHRVAARRDLGTPAVGALVLSPEGKAWLGGIREACGRRGARVAYSMPWHFHTAENIDAARREHLRFLREVSTVMPVLREPSLGAHSVREHFADTVLHPTAEGAVLRTDELAEALGAWTTWTTGDLDARLRPPGP